MSVKALKGFKDILPEEAVVWQRIESLARTLFARYGFSEIRVPILEKTDLFVRSIGEATDIVEKEMYTFVDRNGSSITMRPEGTAPVLRAFVEHSLHVQKPVQRLYTMGPMFRHERPQKGRLRQFHQISVETLGADQPMVDAELMSMAWQLMTGLGLEVSLEMNSLGCPECRPAYNTALLDFLETRAGALCEDCERRRKTNPLRVLDCKNEACREQYQGVPELPDHLCTACDSHFAAVKKLLTSLQIPYKVNAFMVRGLDYYTRTTFELITGDLGAQSAVGAGGRYDSLIGQLGGPKNMPGIGFAVGMERLVLLLQQKGQEQEDPGPDLFIVALGEKAGDEAFKLIHACRLTGLAAILDPAGRSLKNQMKQAGKSGARFTLILGEEELAKGIGVLRNMSAGEQQEIALGNKPKELAGTLAGMITAGRQDQ
ncbi:MAG: histidine--tRNA ligase [Proteobacteria bacterium]|nr:histidine--tRNA ligase [Pseudomonadota bacterium]MBU1739313.1 histidine--tRNA ligase [Pseudomonadota bacterium]